MERIQFYPTMQLKGLLEEEARDKSISVSSLVVELLQEHYGIKPKPTILLADAITKVLDEVEEYVKTISVGECFDLLTASNTFRYIDMTVQGKPATNRATIGKVFASKIGTEMFPNVQFAYKLDGITIERSKNKATMYKKTSK